MCASKPTFVSIELTVTMADKALQPHKAPQDAEQPAETEKTETVDDELAKAKTALLTLTATLETEKARATAEKTRADAEKARADTEKARADAEKARADTELAKAVATQLALTKETARADAVTRMAAQATKDAVIPGVGPLYVPAFLWCLPYMRMSCKAQHRFVQNDVF